MSNDLTPLAGAERYSQLAIAKYLLDHDKVLLYKRSEDDGDQQLKFSRKRYSPNHPQTNQN